MQHNRNETTQSRGDYPRYLPQLSNARRYSIYSQKVCDYRHLTPHGGIYLCLTAFDACHKNQHLRQPKICGVLDCCGYGLQQICNGFPAPIVLPRATLFLSCLSPRGRRGEFFFEVDA